MSAGNVVELRPGARLVDTGTGAVLPDTRSPATPARVRLRPIARLDVEQARAFIYELDGRMRDADPARLAYLIGLAEGHCMSLLDVVDAITEVA
jgi:hypothetical protein